MREKDIITGPGVFMGLSTTKAYEGKTLHFYDGDKLILGVSLNTAFPTKRNQLPGIEEYVFFRRGLRMRYPKEAEDAIEVFVSER